MTPKLDVEKLRALAEKAQTEPMTMPWCKRRNRAILSDALTPEVVFSLLDRLERTERALERIRDHDCHLEPEVRWCCAYSGWAEEAMDSDILKPDGEK